MNVSNESNAPVNQNQSSVIPAEQGDAYQSWLLPDVSAEKVISSAEKIRRDKKKSELELNKANESIEVIEDVEIQPHTAEQLKEIAEAAEKEGYDSGYQKGLIEAKAKGYQEGLDEAKIKIANDTEHLHNIIEALLIPLDIEHKKLEKFILKTVTQMTRVVIQRELLTDSSICLLYTSPSPRDRG